MQKNWLTGKAFIAANIALSVMLMLLLPALTLKAGNMTVEIKQAKAELQALRRQQQAQAVTKRQAQEYHLFAGTLKGFYTNAMQLGLKETFWNKHEVSIIEREVDYDNLKKIIEESQSDLTQYFVPKTLILKRDRKKDPKRKSEKIKLTLFGTYLIHKKKYAEQ